MPLLRKAEKQKIASSPQKPTTPLPLGHFPTWPFLGSTSAFEVPSWEKNAFIIDAAHAAASFSGQKKLDQKKRFQLLRCLWKRRRSSVGAPAVSGAIRPLVYPPPPTDATLPVINQVYKAAVNPPLGICHPWWNVPPPTGMPPLPLTSQNWRCVPSPVPWLCLICKLEWIGVVVEIQAIKSYQIGKMFLRRRKGWDRDSCMFLAQPQQDCVLRTWNVNVGSWVTSLISVWGLLCCVWISQTFIPVYRCLEPVPVLEVSAVVFVSSGFFRPSATVSRIGLMESCTCHRCCGGPPPPHWLTPPRPCAMKQATLWSHVLSWRTPPPHTHWLTPPHCQPW